MATPMEVTTNGSRIMLDSHRHFTQSMMIKKVLKKREAKLLVQDIQRLYEGNEQCTFNEFVSVVNNQLEPLGFKISLGRLERDGSEWVGLVNTLNDTPSKKGTHLELSELDFFRKCLQLIATEDKGIVSSNEIMANVDSLQRKITKKAAQELLNSLVTDKWLSEGPKGHYSMGPLCVLELLPFLPEIVGQSIDECCLCSNYVVMGQRCINCDTKLHLYCIKQLANTRDHVKCPQCHVDWEHELP